MTPNLPPIDSPQDHDYQPPLTAGTKARKIYQEHENRRLMSRQRRSHQRNADRFSALLSHFNEVNRAGRSVSSISEASPVDTRAAGSDASVGSEATDKSSDNTSATIIDYKRIAKAIMKLPGGTRNGRLSVNDIITFIAPTMWRTFVDWLLPPHVDPDVAHGESDHVARGVSLDRFRIYDRDKSLTIEEKELARALEDFNCQALSLGMVESRSGYLSGAFEATLEIFRESANAKDRKRKEKRRAAARKKRFNDRVRNREDKAINLAIPAKMQVVRRQLMAASYVDGGANIELALQRADKDHDDKIDCFELKHLIRRVMQVPKSKISDAEVFGIFRILDADQSGYVEFREVRAFMDGTLWQIKPPTPDNITTRDWGSCGRDTLPTPTHLRPTWKPPKSELEYRPETSLTNLIKINPKKPRPKPLVTQKVIEPPAEEKESPFQKYTMAAELRAKKRLAAEQALVARIATPNPAAAAQRRDIRLNKIKSSGDEESTDVFLATAGFTPASEADTSALLRSAGAMSQARRPPPVSLV